MSLRRIAPIFLICWAMSMMTGCAFNRASANLMPGTDLLAIKTVYVVKQPKDNHGIDQLIKTKLESKGYVVSTGPERSTPYNADAAVTYIDKWMWDITVYMLELTVVVRDPRSNFPLATGHSLHTSLTRKSPEEMVDEVITNIATAPKT